MELDGPPSTVTPPSAVTLTFDLLAPKSNQHMYESKYICNQSWVEFPSLVFDIQCSRGFRYSRTDTLENSMPPTPNVFRGRGIITVHYTLRIQ